jgi:hypothetical protein
LSRQVFCVESLEMALASGLKDVAVSQCRSLFQILSVSRRAFSAPGDGHAGQIQLPNGINKRQVFACMRTGGMAPGASVCDRAVTESGRRRIKRKLLMARAPELPVGLEMDV